MRRSASLTLFLALLSVVSGYLLSNGSWVGRVGMDLFYEEYSFLNTWWQGALVVFAALIFLYVLQSIFFIYSSRRVSQVVNVVALVAAIVGLYLTYDDFRRDFGHRMMGERFHIGAYLFWIGWMIISIYLMLNKKNARALKHKVGMDV